MKNVGEENVTMCFGWWKKILDDLIWRTFL